MKRNVIFYSMSLIIIFSMLVGLTTSTAHSPQLAVQPIMPNTDSPSTDVAIDLPREQTLYFNGLQWGSVVGWNPYSGSMNNAMAVSPKDSARVTMFETPYLYNMLDGNSYPLLADGPWIWNVDKTQLTFTIKTDAHWSDGTPVTADDVAYTWASIINHGSDCCGYTGYINNITAFDAQTVLVEAKLDGGEAINPLMVESYLNSIYVIQKAWTQTLEARTGGDPGAFNSDPAEDVVWSGPYHKFYTDDTIVALVRDDNYWGQNASMWGRLSSPTYLAHVIYPDNEAGNQAFKAGQVDISQQFISNVQDLWLVDHLPISTYLPDAPYGIGASLPTAFYNLNAYGLDNAVIRKAIAIAVDYDLVITNAMSNQSATFEQVPRSLMNPSPAEQAMYDHAAVADLQWTGNDIAGANQLLDDAGIIDTNADGWREYNGETLVYTATCPMGWTDWMAAIEIVADAGQAIGIDTRTNYPEWSEYQTVVTASDQPLPPGYEIFMMWSDGAGPTQPWGRIHHLISSEFVGMPNNWNGNWGGYVNPAADAIIQAIPHETDPANLLADYTDLVEIYLTDIPSFTLMYRPDLFHTVNETYWTGFPHQGDSINPPVPPMLCTDGYSIACLYNIRLVNPYQMFLPAINRQ